MATFCHCGPIFNISPLQPHLTPHLTWLVPAMNAFILGMSQHTVGRDGSVENQVRLIPDFK